jgi:tRNA pseudouridine38-40 synthase
MPAMARYRITVEYEGTRYHGWQMQANARTVQGELLRACREVLGATELDLQGAGRTDAGVHALAQVAHLEVRTTMPCRAMAGKLNDALPHDICVLAVESAPARFHARHHATSRSYLYQIARRRTALGKRYVWWVRDTLALEPMRDAAARFVGMHDFRSFADRRADEGSTQVLVEELRIAEAGDLVLVRMRGSHFLWRMVRRVVGVLVSVGRRELTPAAAGELLEGLSPLPATLTAPASGLFLERVYYPGDAIEEDLRPVVRIS